MLLPRPRLFLIYVKAKIVCGSGGKSYLHRLFSRLGRSTSITTADSTFSAPRWGLFRPPICPKPIRHFTLLVKPTYRPTTKVSCPNWMSNCVIGIWCRCLGCYCMGLLDLLWLGAALMNYFIDGEKVGMNKISRLGTFLIPSLMPR